MQGLTISHLANLFAATESVCDDQRFFPCTPNNRKEHALTATDRNIVMVLLKTEPARHTAAARVNDLKIKAESVEQFRVALHFHNRLMMAMAVHERFSCESWNPMVRREFVEKLGERKRLL